ncbi:MAG: acylphosphatase [Fibrobacteres bacterium]|jgi:acylphosphatase|nr:acylphosphatase [Fibrobacterota bacterium]
MTTHPPILFAIRVSGRVQGVFFRASARIEAGRLGLSGFVRNEPDGSVYAEAEGEREALDLFVEWCRRGPPHARVESVEVKEGTAKGFAGFMVR